jgi:hypothetical protein
LLLDGGRPVADAVRQDLGGFVAGVVTAANQELPADLDDELVEGLLAWLATVEPAGILAQLQGWAGGESFDFLQGCGQPEDAQ